MSITRFWDRRIAIRRVKDIGGRQTSYHATATVEAHMQKLSDRNDAVALQVYGATHKAWVEPSVDVRDGDRVIYDGERYDVVAIDYKDYDFALNEHKEIFLRKYNA